MAKGPTRWQRARGRPKVWIYRWLTRQLCIIDGHRLKRIEWTGCGFREWCERPFCDFSWGELPTKPNAEGEPVAVPVRPEPDRLTPRRDY